MYIKALKKKELTLEKLMKMWHIMNMYKSETIFYSELFIIIKKEWIKQEHTDMRHALIKEKNFIVNCVITKSHIKAYNDVKNIIKRFSDEKRKCVFV